MPTTARAGRGGAQPGSSSTAVQGAAPYPRSTATGVVGAAQCGAVRGRDPAVHAAQPVRVGGPAGHGADGARRMRRAYATGYGGYPRCPRRAGPAGDAAVTAATSVMIRRDPVMIRQSGNGTAAFRLLSPSERAPAPPSGMPASEEDRRREPVRRPGSAQPAGPAPGSAGGFAGCHRKPRRVAMLSVHTSPLHQPGTGDAGGMNVYIVELAKRLAAINIEVEIFTRATTGALPPDGRAGPRRPRPARRRGPVRGARQGGPARPAVRLHARRDAGLGRPPPRLLRPGPLPLLALRPRRLARRRALGRPPGARHAHHGQGQERRARRRRHPRARRPRHRRDPDRRAPPTG